jgi:hypothetical protein
MEWSRRQRTHGSGRSIVLLASVLAVLAFACFPALAQADSSGAQYITGVNGAGGHPEKEKIAKKSQEPEPNGGATAPTGQGSGSAETGGGSYTEAPSSGSGGGGVAAAQKNDAGKGQGKPENGSTQGGKANVQHTAPSSSKAPSSDDGGSSAVLWILLGVLALAAISVGAFMVRQRRQRDDAGPSLSTKAG